MNVTLFMIHFKTLASFFYFIRPIWIGVATIDVHNKLFRTVFDRIRLTIGSVLQGKYKESAISSADHGESLGKRWTEGVSQPHLALEAPVWSSATNSCTKANSFTFTARRQFTFTTRNDQDHRSQLGAKLASFTSPLVCITLGVNSSLRNVNLG